MDGWMDGGAILSRVFRFAGIGGGLSSSFSVLACPYLRLHVLSVCLSARLSASSLWTFI